MGYHYKRKFLLTACALAILPGAVEAEDGSLTLTSGVDYSSGDYGSPIDTDILYVPISLKYAKGPWALRVSSGFIDLEGPGGVIPGGDTGPINAPDRRRLTKTSESGIGDTYISLILSPEFESDPDLFLDLTTKVKIPTADEDKGLGTGKTDFTIQADLAKLYGGVMPFGSVGYRVVGNPKTFELNNTFFASLGAAYYFTPRVSLGTSYDFREASSPFADSDGHEIFTYLNIATKGRVGISLYNVIGLTDDSPDFAIGLQFTVTAF